MTALPPHQNPPDEIAALSAISFQLHEIAQALALNLAALNRASSLYTLAASKRMAQSGQTGSLQIIAENVSFNMELPVTSLTGKSRTANIVAARHIALFLSVRLTDCSSSQIGRFYHRDHTTVLHARDRIAEWETASDQRFNRVKRLQENLSAKLAAMHGAAQ
jgi:chromosomal replication initiator protein